MRIQCRAHWYWLLLLFLFNFVYSFSLKASSLIRLDFLKVVFSGMWGQFDRTLYISRRTNSIIIQLYTTVNKNKLKLKKGWHHLLWTNAIGFFVKAKCQKIQKMTKIVTIEEESLLKIFRNIFWATWWISTKFLEGFSLKKFFCALSTVLALFEIAPTKIK